MGPQDGPGDGRSVNDQPARGWRRTAGPCRRGARPDGAQHGRGSGRSRRPMAPRGRPARTALRWRQPSRSSSASGGVPRRRGRATDGATDGTHPCGCPPGRSACADHRSRSTAAGGPGLSPRRPVVESRRMSPPAPVSARQLRWPRSAVGIAPTLREGLGETTRPCNTVVSKYRGPGSQRDRAVSKQVHRR